MDRLGRLVALLLLLVATTTGRPALAAAPTPLDEAVALQREGRNREAQTALRALLPGLRGASDRAALARALTALDRGVPRPRRLRGGDPAGPGGVRAPPAARPAGGRGLGPQRGGAREPVPGPLRRRAGQLRAGAGARSRGRRRRRRSHPPEQHRQRPLHARPVCRRPPALRGGDGARRGANVRGRPGAAAEDDDLQPGRAASAARRLSARARPLRANPDRRGHATEPGSAAPGQSGDAPAASGRSDQGPGDLPPGAGPLRPGPAPRRRDRDLAQHRHRLRAGPRRQPAGIGRVRHRAEAGAAVVEPPRRSPGPALPRRDAAPAGPAERSQRGPPGRPRRCHRRRSRRRAVEGSLRPRPDRRGRRPERGGGPRLRAGHRRHRVGSRRPPGRPPPVRVPGRQARRLRRAHRAAPPRALGLGGGGVRAHRAEPRARLAGPPSARRRAVVARKRADEDRPRSAVARVLERRGRLGRGVGLSVRGRHRPAGGERGGRRRSPALRGRRGSAGRRLAHGVTARRADPPLRLAGPGGREPAARRTGRAPAPRPLRSADRSRHPRSARRPARDRLPAVGRAARPEPAGTRRRLDVAVAEAASGLRRPAGRARHRGNAPAAPFPCRRRDPSHRQAPARASRVARRPGRPEADPPAGGAEGRRCCTSPRTRSRTRAIPTGRAYCSPPRRPAARPTTCS